MRYKYIGTSELLGFELCSSTGILEIRKHNVSETGSNFVLRRGGGTPTLLDPLERANLSHSTTPVRFTTGIYHLRPG
jgi:hypothetical protein